MVEDSPTISIGLFWQRMVLLGLIPAFQGISGMGAIAHGTVLHPLGFWVCGLLFLIGPFLAWNKVDPLIKTNFHSV